jgi:hypothetical protein
MPRRTPQPKLFGDIGCHYCVVPRETNLALPARTATGPAATRLARAHRLLGLYPNNFTGARWRPRDRPSAVASHEATKPRSHGVEGRGLAICDCRLNEWRGGNYELRVTNCRQDRFRRGGSDSVGYVIDIPSSWNAANATGDGRTTTCPTRLSGAQCHVLTPMPEPVERKHCSQSSGTYR